MAKITIDGLEPNQVLTVSLHDLVYEEPEGDDPEEILPEEEARIANLVGLPKKTAWLLRQKCVNDAIEK